MGTTATCEKERVIQIRVNESEMMLIEKLKMIVDEKTAAKALIQAAGKVVNDMVKLKINLRNCQLELNKKDDFIERLGNAYAEEKRYRDMKEALLANPVKRMNSQFIIDTDE